MSKISFHKKASGNNQSAVLEQIHQLRHETFVERLDWEVSSVNGKESDRFDELDAVHIAVSSVNGQVDGCWRALPTAGSYMLEEVFPELLQGEAAPKHPTIWEISRFAVRKGSSEVSKGYMGKLTIDMVRSFWGFAQEYGVTAYVTVTSVACERMLRQLGVTLRRMGEGEAMQIGKEKTVALYIEVDRNLCITTH
jgi:N-acyl-L-homoserine lactone synthetase